MKALTACLLAAIGSGYGFAAAACEPPAPVPLPDGATATRDQMLAAQAQVRAYQAAMNELLACIDSELETEGEQAPDEFKSLMVSRHNAAVAEMEGVAAAFNDQLRAFRAANPAPAAN
jgi:tagatose-1,6-bisphosphate aldolase non-catalytic subunit AgaZ/GatZ